MQGPIAALGRTRAVVRVAMVVERLWPLVLPLVIIVSLFLSFAWLGVFRVLPDWGRLGLLGLLGASALASLWPLRHFRMPHPAEIDRRIEVTNRLEHAPVSVQSDRLAAGADSSFASALWREHQKRMSERLSRLHGDLPQTRVPQRDPWGFRAFAALLLVTALAYSTGPYGGRILDAFQPPAGEEAAPARIDAWVTPPAYTGRAPIFLTADSNRTRQAFTVPQNSTMAVRVSSGSGAETLSFIDVEGDEHAIAPEEGSESEAAAGGAQRFAHVLSADGIVRLSNDGHEIGDWQFMVTPDMPPQIRFSEEPARATNGALELSYEIEDDYGVEGAEAHFALADPAPDARPLYEAPEMPLSLPRRDSENGASKTTRDLSEHPWAGAEIGLTLSATDAAGQTAESGTKILELPQRMFTNPLARAVIEQRRELALDARQQDRVVDLMNAILLWPEETFDNTTHYLLLSSARARLAMAQSDDALRGVVDDLWEIALMIEEGAMSDAEQRLSQAREALRQALEEGATEEEIQRLMDELRAAMQEFLREFAERAMQNQDFAESPDGEMMNSSDLEEMLDRLEDLARSGAREEAQDLLSQLENMMNNLQAARPQQGQGGEQSQMRQQMDELGNIMRRQQELMNETFRLDQGEQGQNGQQGQQQGQQGQPGQQPGQGQSGQGQNGQGMSPQELAEALQELQQGQGDLQQQLEGLAENLENFGISPGEGFGEAGEAMGQAEGALGEGEGDRAVGEQGRALEALRRGAQDMMNQMQQAMRGQQGEGQQGARQDGFGRDPLGRPRSSTGPDFGDSVDVPDELDTQRAREILDAIRRRLGDALSPEVERQYLERLLDMQ
uniref:TIGR02302 family protein n=1 Tax=Chelativorans sp. YIM 93263 TaxID=2906648 RepID=UPI002379B1A5|nr:TIGR02302 family protein [Chelativorans sp. YIM 93263]